MKVNLGHTVTTEQMCLLRGGDTVHIFYSRKRPHSGIGNPMPIVLRGSPILAIYSYSQSMKLVEGDL